MALIGKLTEQDFGMESAINTLDIFIKKASENKVWAFAWVVFVSAIFWSWSFVQSMPSEYAKFDQYSVDLDAALADGPKSLTVVDVISPTFKLFTDVRVYYLENLQGKQPYENIDAQIALNGFTLTSNALGQTTSARGIIKGIEFSDAELNAFKEGFAEDLTAMESDLRSYEQFFLALVSKDTNKALELTPSLGGTDASEAVATLYTRLGSFSEKSQLAARRDTVQARQYINEYQIFNVKFYLLLASLLYIGGFIVAAFFGWRKSQLAKASVKRGNPKKR